MPKTQWSASTLYCVLKRDQPRGIIRSVNPLEHRSAVVVGAVEAINCRLSFGVGTHFDKAKALASASVTIGDQFGGFHGSGCREFIRQFLLGRRVRQIADIEFPAHDISFTLL